MSLYGKEFRDNLDEDCLAYISEETGYPQAMIREVLRSLHEFCERRSDDLEAMWGE